MCDCIKKLEEKVAQQQEAKSATFICRTISDDPELFSEMELTIIGKKKKFKIDMFYNYCPFCGEKNMKNKLD